MAPKRNPTASGSRGEPDSRGGTTRRAPPYPPRGGAAPHPSGRSAPTRGAVEGAGGSARRAPAVRDDKALADAAAVALHSGAGGGGENDTRGDGGDCPEELVGAGEIVRGEEGGALGGMGVFGRDGVAGRDVVPDEQAVLGVGGVPDDGPVPDVFLRESPGPKGVSCESSGPRAILCESHAPDGGESAGTPSGATLLGTRETPPDVRALGASLQGLLIHAPAAAATRDYPATPAFPLADDHVRTTRGHAQDVRVPASRGDSAGAASALFAAGFGGGARSESSAGVSATSSRMTTRDGYLCQDPYCGLSGGDYEGDEDTRQLVVDVGLRLIASFRGEAVSSANALRSWANSVVKKNALQEVVAFMGPRLVMKVIGLATRARNKDVGLERHLAEAAAEGVNERDAFIGYLDLVYDHWGQEGATRLGPRMSPAAMPFKWRSFHEELYARFLSMGETPASTREESSGPRVVGLTLVREYAESAVDNADCACRPSSAGAAPPTTRTSTAAAQVDPQRIDLPWPANDAPARFSLPDVSGSTPVRVRASPRRSLGGLEIGRQAVDRRASRNSADKVARSGEILRRQARQAEFEIPPPVVLPTTPSRNRVRGHVPSSLGHRRAFKNYCGIDPSHPDSDGNDGVGLKPTMHLPDYDSELYDVDVYGYRPSTISPAFDWSANKTIVHARAKPAQDTLLRWDAEYRTAPPDHPACREGPPYTRQMRLDIGLNPVAPRDLVHDDGGRAQNEDDWMMERAGRMRDEDAPRRQHERDGSSGSANRAARDSRPRIPVASDEDVIGRRSDRRDFMRKRFYVHAPMPPVTPPVVVEEDDEEYVRDIVRLLREDAQVLESDEGGRQVSATVFALPAGFGTRSIKTDQVPRQIAAAMFPASRDPITLYIDLVKRLRGACNEQHKLFEEGGGGRSCARGQNPAVVDRIVADGGDELSLEVLEPLAMPVTTAAVEELQPFFRYLSSDCSSAVLKEGGALFLRGCLFSGGRMDMCKQVVGSAHIAKLCEVVSASRPGRVRHFLLGNNVSCGGDAEGGASALASLMSNDALAIETFYLAGNAINAEAMEVIGAALADNTTVTALWLKRNPLEAASADALGEVLARDKALQLSDLDNTGLLDEGVEKVLLPLAADKALTLPLRHLYLGACGISGRGAKAIATFVSSPAARNLETICLSMNAIGSPGAIEIASAFSSLAESGGRTVVLKRLSFASSRVTSDIGLAREDFGGASRDFRRLLVNGHRLDVNDKERENVDVAVDGLRAEEELIAPTEALRDAWLAALRLQSAPACMTREEITSTGYVKSRKLRSDFTDSANSHEQGATRLRLGDDSTLVVLPPSLLSQWKDEAESKAPSLKVHVWKSFGTEKSDQSMAVGEDVCNIVLAKYDHLQRDKLFPIIHWNLLILDEAQLIRRSMSVLAEVCLNMQCSSRFLMTGTPLVQGIQDLAGELAFLRMWHVTLLNDGYFERHVEEPWVNRNSHDPLDKLVASTMIRRSKAQSNIGLSLPARSYRILKVGRYEGDEDANGAAANWKEVRSEGSPSSDDGLHLYSTGNGLNLYSSGTTSVRVRRLSVSSQSLPGHVWETGSDANAVDIRDKARAFFRARMTGSCDEDRNGTATSPAAPDTWRPSLPGGNAMQACGWSAASAACPVSPSPTPSVLRPFVLRAVRSAELRLTNTVAAATVGILSPPRAVAPVWHLPTRDTEALCNIGAMSFAVIQSMTRLRSAKLCKTLFPSAHAAYSSTSDLVFSSSLSTCSSSQSFLSPPKFSFSPFHPSTSFSALLVLLPLPTFSPSFTSSVSPSVEVGLYATAPIRCLETSETLALS